MRTNEEHMVQYANKIPKIIHYCWFGGKALPNSAKKCIASWEKFFPDYEIKEWNEDNFDVNMVPYIAEAYKAKKYAFVSDYARFWVLFKYGGLYFDTDVEVIKPMDEIVARGPFMGCEEAYVENADVSASALSVNPGLGLGVYPGHEFYGRLLDLYANEHYILPNGLPNPKTIVDFTSDLLIKYGLTYTPDIQQCADLWIYPKEYFNPRKSYTSPDLKITSKTVCIHHFSATWLPWYAKMENYIFNMLGFNSPQILRRAVYKLKIEVAKWKKQN